MRKLDRNRAVEPACLKNYEHPAQKWEHVRPEDKVEIRGSLEIVQGRRCAYCEGSLDALGHHIEHFRRRKHFGKLTFAWTNLYWSCDQTDSCGHYKDHGAGPYKVEDLIDPCSDDPDQYFRFRTDGTISIRPGLGVSSQHKAAVTLRVFNLNPQWGRLRNMRKAALLSYLTLVADNSDFSANELQDFFSDELSQALSQPFFTAIRHILTEPF